MYLSGLGLINPAKLVAQVKSARALSIPTGFVIASAPVSRPVPSILVSQRAAGSIPPRVNPLQHKSPVGYTSGVSFPQAPAGRMNPFPNGSGSYAKNAASERLVKNLPAPSFFARPNIVPATLPSGARADSIPKVLTTGIPAEDLQKNYSGATTGTPTLSIVPQPPIIEVVGNDYGGTSIVADRSTLPPAIPSASAAPIVFEPPVVNVTGDPAAVKSAGFSPLIALALVGAAFFMLKGRKK